MAVNHQQQSLWREVLELTKTAQDRNTDPLTWAIQLSSTLNSAADGDGLTLPSTELAHLLVSHICWDNHVPITWKFLEKALTLNIVPPSLVLALLSTRFKFSCFYIDAYTYNYIVFFFCFFLKKLTKSWEMQSFIYYRVISNRQLHPAAYRLYLELLTRHAFSFASLVNGPNYDKYESNSFLFIMSHLFDLGSV